MMELFQYGFMRRALAAGMIVGVLCPLIGIFLVLRRMSLIGDSLSHVALVLHRHCRAYARLRRAFSVAAALD